MHLASRREFTIGPEALDKTTVFQSLVIQMHTQTCLHGVYHSHVPWFLPRLPHIASQGAVRAHLPESVKHRSIDARLHIR